MTGNLFGSETNQTFPVSYVSAVYVWARGGVVGWGTMLQARRSWVRYPMRSLQFFFSNYLILPAASMAIGSTQPLTEMCTKNLAENKRATDA
jgi:hypothetical protein